MSITLAQNTLRVKNKETGEMQPIAMFGSGADKTLTEIGEYAEQTKNEIKAAADTAKADIQAKTDEQVARIPEVTALAKDVSSLEGDLAKVSGFDFPLTLANGSPTSTGNPYYVRSTNGISVRKGDKITIHTNRPNANGNHYVYGWYFYNSDGNLVSFYPVNVESKTSAVYVDFDFDYVIVLIGEYTETGTVVALRTDSFNGYNVSLKVERIANTTYKADMVVDTNDTVDKVSEILNIKHRNIFDCSKIVWGVTLSTADGSKIYSYVSASIDYFIGKQIFEVKKDDVIYCLVNYGMNLYFYDENFNFVGSYNNIFTDGIYVVPFENARYMRVCGKMSKDAVKERMLSINVPVPTVYTPYSEIYSPILDNIRHECRHVVKKDGTGDYTKIQDAINASADGDEVYVCSGEYEESLDLGIKNIRLIGENPLTTIVFDTSGEYSKAPIICGSGYISGFTFWSKRLDKEYTFQESRRSYAMHLDKRWGGNKKIQIDNCIFINDFAGSIGCGVTDDVHILLTNCRVITTVSNASAFQIHGDGNGTGNANIEIRNCIMEINSGNGNGLLLSNGGETQNVGTTLTIMANGNKCSFYNNCGDLFILHNSSWGNSDQNLNA